MSTLTSSASLPTLPSRPGTSTSSRVDHLGVTVRPLSRQKHKYARTYTMLYDKRQEEDREAEKQWQVLRDARRTMDVSLPSLSLLFRLFQQEAAGPEHSLIGPQAFHSGFANLGVADPIFVQRLFDAFCEKEDMGMRIDYRHFLRILISVNPEPITDRISLLFDIWDADEVRQHNATNHFDNCAQCHCSRCAQSGSLSYSELAPHIIHDLPAHKREVALENFNRVWRQIRSFNRVGNATSEVERFGASSEVTREDLVEACIQLPAVSMYLQKVITREPPKASEFHKASNLQALLRRLDREVKEEVNGVAGTSPSASQKHAQALKRTATPRFAANLNRSKPKVNGRSTTGSAAKAVLGDMRLTNTLGDLHQRTSQSLRPERTQARLVTPSAAKSSKSGAVLRHAQSAV